MIYQRKEEEEKHNSFTSHAKKKKMKGKMFIYTYQSSHPFLTPNKKNAFV